MRRATKVVAPIEDSLRLVVEDLCAPSILERILREAEPYLKRVAAYLAEDYPAVRPDLVQEGRITLWQLDLGRFPHGAAQYLKRILYNRMFRVYRTECLEGLTTGWSPHATRRTRKALGGSTGMKKAA